MTVAYQIKEKKEKKKHNNYKLKMDQLTNDRLKTSRLHWVGRKTFHYHMGSFHTVMGPFYSVSLPLPGSSWRVYAGCAVYSDLAFIYTRGHSK